MKIIRRWYEDMKLLHLSLLRSGENLQSAVSLLQSFSICVCSVTEGCSTRSLGSISTTPPVILLCQFSFSRA